MEKLEKILQEAINEYNVYKINFLVRAFDKRKGKEQEGVPGEKDYTPSPMPFDEWLAFKIMYSDKDSPFREYVITHWNRFSDYSICWNFIAKFLDKFKESESTLAKEVALDMAIAKLRSLWEKYMGKSDEKI